MRLEPNNQTKKEKRKVTHQITAESSAEIIHVKNPKRERKLKTEKVRALKGRDRESLKMVLRREREFWGRRYLDTCRALRVPTIGRLCSSPPRGGIQVDGSEEEHAHRKLL